MKTKFSLLLVLLLASLLPQQTFAHEMRPALLQIKQTAEHNYDLTWKIPRKGNMVISLKPVFPDWFQIQPNPVVTEAGDGALYIFKAIAKRDLHNMAITIDGIQQSAVDVLVYIELLNGQKFSLVIQPAHARVFIPEKESFLQTAKVYLLLGIEHILFGIDHLLFVLALLLIVSGTRKMIYTITAFTLAHSITLSLSVLGYVGLSGPPVEAAIALSIMFLAWELVKLQKGEKVISSEKPWLVSFSFGLLHGLGFASALQSVGLPQTQVPAALAFFNIGVEIGQLLFISAMLLLIKFIFSMIPLRGWLKKVPAYVIGSIAAFWVIERVMGFWE